MKNQFLFLTFFALLLTSKAQTNNNTDVGEAVVGVVTNEEATISVVANEEAIVTVSNNEESPIVTNEEANAVLLTNEEAAPITAPPQNTVINTTNQAGPTLTIQAPPVPVNVALPNDQAADNLKNSASDLRDVNGDVLITNPDGTTSIVDASDLASDLSSDASDLSDGDATVVLPDGGNVQFVPLSAQTWIVSAGTLAVGCAYLVI